MLENYSSSVNSASVGNEVEDTNSYAELCAC